jgi:hypothetical protein
LQPRILAAKDSCSKDSCSKDSCSQGFLQPAIEYRNVRKVEKPAVNPPAFLGRLPQTTPSRHIQ